MVPGTSLHPKSFHGAGLSGTCSKNPSSSSKFWLALAAPEWMATKSDGSMPDCLRATNQLLIPTVLGQLLFSSTWTVPLLFVSLDFELILKKTIFSYESSSFHWWAHITQHDWLNLQPTETNFSWRYLPNITPDPKTMQSNKLSWPWPSQGVKDIEQNGQLLLNL